VATAQEHLTKKSAPGWSAHPWVQRLSAAHGRGTATALLALIAICYVLFGEAVWSPVRNLLFDAYQRFVPRQVPRYPVVIVDIDDESLAAFGRWPWPRTRLAQLIEATRRLGALAVGIDMIMPEADSLSPSRLLAGRSNISPALRDALAALPSNDTVLANTLRQVPSVIARAALVEAETKSAVGTTQTPVIIVGESPAAYLQSYPAELANIPEIEAAAFGRGYVNDTRDSDGVVRAMPLVIAVSGAPAPALALELLRVAAGQIQYSVRTSDTGILGVQIGDLFIPTDGDGRLRLYFSPAYAARRVSAAAILRGTVAPKGLANQVAIIGTAAVGIGDVAATPVATRMDGTEIQAQLVENILFGARLTRSPPTRWWELLALLALGLILIVLLPRFRPVYGVIIFGAGSFVLGLVSFVCFQRLHLLYDPSFPVAGNVFVVGLLLTAGFSASDRRRRQLDAALEAERIERFHIAGELRAAREIQMGMLPDPHAIDGLPATLDFFALLEPAQEVGGDFYDALMIDGHRLYFMIGDVSGKGVPASLFMALTKTLSKSLARREHLPLDQLLRSVNDEISQENPAAMFVTAIIGTIDASSGEVELCNAGHNPPVLLRSQEIPLTLEGANGPPLCVDEDFPYATQWLKLDPGDILLFITDGVSEAEDEQQSQYGSARVLDCFTSGLPTRASEACETLRANVKSFTADAPASDDLTIMAIRFVGSDAD
jgi:adenylate cyclase